MILHSGRYEYGDRLSPDHERTILERVLPYHPAYENKIGSGVDHITAVEKIYMDMINRWRRRKRIIKDYGLQSRKTPRRKEFEEELRLEYDEDLGVSLQSFDDLVLSVNKEAKHK